MHSTRLFLPITGLLPKKSHTPFLLSPESSTLAALPELLVTRSAHGTGPVSLRHHINPHPVLKGQMRQISVPKQAPKSPMTSAKASQRMDTAAQKSNTKPDGNGEESGGRCESCWGTRRLDLSWEWV